MKGGIFTVSNALSLLRILLVFPISLLLQSDSQGGRNAALVLILAAGVTDFLDGYVARKRGQVTELGKILDPVADKIAVGAVALILALQGRIPAWFLAAILTRDLLILTGGYYLARKRFPVMQSNRLGKWTAGVLAITLFASVAGAGQAIRVLLPVSSLMIVASSVSYGIRFFSAVSGTRVTHS